MAYMEKFKFSSYAFFTVLIPTSLVTFYFYMFIQSGSLIYDPVFYPLYALSIHYHRCLWCSRVDNRTTGQFVLS